VRRLNGWSERAGIGAAVDQDVLPGDVAGLSRAQQRAGRAEFIRVTGQRLMRVCDKETG
jgi:hypothetical protein